MTKILVQARGAVGKTMGSTGVRSYHTARVLAEQMPEAQVTLAVPNEPGIPSPHPRLRIVRMGNQRDVLSQMMRHDTIVSRNFLPHMAALCFNKLLALDFYSWFFIEWMEISKGRVHRKRRRVWNASNQHYSDVQLTLADFMFCSSERQRDLWVGSLGAMGLITPQVYGRDNTLRRLIDVVPYGVQPGSPEHKRRVLKGVVPGIRETDKVLIWNGSIVEWFDAETVIRAMVEVSRVRDDVKLFFLGTEHPDFVTGVLLHPPRRAVELSKELGLHERCVFFNVGWVPYQEIGDYLAESDIGVCAGFDNLEARFAFRTRFVDLFWAELPIICTGGDVLAQRIERDPLGIVVPTGNVNAYAAAILRLVEDQELYDRCRRNMPAIKEELSWDRVLAPLVEFCRSGSSIAAPKRQRLLPLLRRTARYAGTRVRHMQITD
jgi:glycosyltransferase involved in cell wall biosynthesis